MRRILVVVALVVAMVPAIVAPPSCYPFDIGGGEMVMVSDETADGLCPNG